MIYTFRSHRRAYKKANEMLFEIIYTYIVVCGCGFSVIQVKASKFTEKEHFKRTEIKRRFTQHIIDLFFFV